MPNKSFKRDLAKSAPNPLIQALAVYMKNHNEYTGNHTHPTGTYSLEFVAFERNDGSWDLYLEEPEGSCPEFDDKRDNDGQVFLSNTDDIDKINEIADKIINQVGPEYEMVLYYRELSQRKTTQKIWDHMKKNGCHGMYLSNDGIYWELYIRRKDFDIATNYTTSNVDS